MKHKNGFTLIELLAVIVILAVIALIATPLIMGVIDDAKKGSFKDSIYAVLKAGDIYSATVLTKANDFNGVTIDFSKDSSLLKMSGDQPGSGVLTIDKKGNQSILIPSNNQKYCASKSFGADKVVVEDYKNSKCTSYMGNPLTGIVEDLSDKNNDGMIHGTTIENNEAVFNGNSYINAGYIGYDFKDKITMVARFYYPNGSPVGAHNSIVGNWEAAGGGIHYVTTETNSWIRFLLHIGGSYKVVEVSNITTGTYHTVVVTYNGTTMELYVDGVRMKSSPMTGSILPSAVPIQVGNNASLPGKALYELMTGKVTDVLVMNRSVTSSEVAANFKDTVKVLNDPNVLFQYKF